MRSDQQLLIALVAAATGCGRINFDPPGTGIDAPGADATLCTGPFGAPVHDPILNTPFREWAPAESADGLTLYFSSNRSGNEELFRTTRSAPGAAWDLPEIILELAMAGDEEENPSPSADELELYWGGSQVRRASRNSGAGQFGSVTVVISPTAGFVNPQGPHIATDKLSLYFTAETTTGADVFVVKRANDTVPFDGVAAVRIDELSTGANEGWPALSPDERVIFYTSNASGNLDILTASRDDRASPFGAAIPVDQINTTADEEDAAISADGQTLWFASTRSDGGALGDYDIWFAQRSCP